LGTKSNREIKRDEKITSLKKKESTSNHTLVGCWISGTESGGKIEYVVNSHSSGFKVKAIDRFDSEAADIFEVKWDGRILSFGTLWNSTGRFLRCQFQAIAKNEVSYTYTANETWHRKSA
jgi:hypothetical protein